MYQEGFIFEEKLTFPSKKQPKSKHYIMYLTV